MRRIPLVWALALTACPGGSADKPPQVDLVEPDEDADDTSSFDTAPVPSDGNDDIATAEDHTSATFSDVATPLGEGVINPEEDRDYYTVDLTAGELYFFWVDSGVEGAEPGELDSVLSILSEGGASLGFGDDMIYLAYGYDGGLFFAPTTSGTYALMVQEYGDFADDGADGDDSFTFALFGASLGPVEATDVGGDMATASPLPEGPNLPLFDMPAFFGRLATADDEDWFAFTVPADAADPAIYQVTFWYGYEPIEPDVAVLDVDGVVLASTQDPLQAIFGAAGMSNGSDHGLVFRGTPGEAYYVRVRDAEGAPSDDAVWVATWGLLTGIAAEAADEASAEQVDATPLTDAVELGAGFYGMSAWGWLEESTGVDWFVISAADLATWDVNYVSVWLRATTLGSSVDARITVYDGEGSEIGDADEDEFMGTPDPLVIDVDADGDLFIKVEAEDVDDPTTARGYLIEAFATEDKLVE